MKLIDKLPYFYEECPKTNTIQEGLQSEAEVLYRKVDNTVKQLYVSSATWGLDLWEKFAGIKKKANTIEERRSKVIAKLTAKGTTTLEVIEAICKSYVDDAIVIEYPREYKILIELIETKEFDFSKEYNLADIDSAIWEVKPAHLDHNLRICNSRKLNIHTKYEDYNFKYHPCNTLYAGELQANTYYKDSQLAIINPLIKNDIAEPLVGSAIADISILSL